MSTECHWKVRLASQRSKRLYLDWERLLRRLETNRTLFEVVPSGGCIPRWVFPTERGGSQAPGICSFHPLLTRQTSISREYHPEGSVYHSGGSRGGVRGGPPLTYFRPNWGPKGQKNLFYKSPPLSQGLDDLFPPPPPPTPPYPKAVPPK